MKKEKPKKAKAKKAKKPKKPSIADKLFKRGKQLRGKADRLESEANKEKGRKKWHAPKSALKVHQAKILRAEANLSDSKGAYLVFKKAILNEERRKQQNQKT